MFADDSKENFSYIGDTIDGRRCYESGYDSGVNFDEKIKKAETAGQTRLNQPSKDGAETLLMQNAHSSTPETQVGQPSEKRFIVSDNNRRNGLQGP